MKVFTISCWLWILAMVTSVNTMPVLEDTLAYNYPWFPGYNPNWHNSQIQLRPRLFLLNWVDVPEERRVPKYPDRSQVPSEGPAAEAGKSEKKANDKTTSDETDTYAAPKYGGACPLSRYGIDYSNRRGRPRKTMYTGIPHPYNMPEFKLQP